LGQSVVAAVTLIDGAEAAGLSRRSRVYKSCLKAILDGRLWPGARMPAARELARAWEISRNTIDEALLQLQADGFLERRVGDGTYVAERLPGRLAEQPREPRAASRAGQRALERYSAGARTAVDSHVPHGMPRPRAILGAFPALDLFPLRLWQRLTARRLRDGRRLLGYFPSMGYEPLREATCRHLALTRGVVCTPEQVMILNSAMQALDLIVRVVIERGDEAWVEEGGYPNVRVALSMANVKHSAIRVDAEGLDVGAIQSRARAPGLVHVTPAVHYSTGAQLSLKRRLALLRWAERTGAWIVEDDFWGEFTHEGRPLETLQSLDRGGRVLHVGSFSSSVFPSLRLAYLVIPPAMVPVFEAVRAQTDDPTHGIQQAVLAVFIDEGHLSAHLRRMRPIYKERRDVLLEACAKWLPRCEPGPATAGFSVALNVPRGQPDTALRERAGKLGLDLMQLSRFDPALNGFLMGFAALTPAAIRDGVKRLATLLGSGYISR
jgi:GntR family transcriptional regulator/MocR family aminotransferase